MRMRTWLKPRETRRSRHRRSVLRRPALATRLSEEKLGDEHEGGDQIDQRPRELWHSRHRHDSTQPTRRSVCQKATLTLSRHLNCSMITAFSARWKQVWHGNHMPAQFARMSSLARHTRTLRRESWSAETASSIASRLEKTERGTSPLGWVLHGTRLPKNHRQLWQLLCLGK